ncbi:MAG: ABC transporter substrate-binding protein [bacterium]
MRWLLLLTLLGTGCRDTRTLADDLPADARVIVLLPETIKGSLDPRLNTRAWPAKLIELVHEGVVSVQNPAGEPRPALAARIDRPAPAVYDITLRDDATFHDQSPVTADDVVATYESIRDPAFKSPFRDLYARIDHMEVLGPKRLRITLTEAHAPFLSDLSVGILPRASLGPDGALRGDVGAGPYRLVAREGEREVVLARHDGYWRGRPTMPWLVFRTVADQNTRVLALLGGAADLAQNQVTPRLADALRARPELVVETTPGAGYSYVAYNLRRPPLDDVRVRRAFALAVDRAALITHKFRGTARPATGLLPAQHWAFNKEVVDLPHDPAEAERLLDAAGRPRPAGGGPRFSVTLKVSADKFRRNLAMLIAHDLAQVGVEVVVQPLETGTLLADVKGGNFDLYMLQWQGGGEPHFFNWIFHSDRIPTADEPNRGGNRGAYRNPAVDALIDAGRAEPDLDRRRAIYGQIQALLLADQPYLSLWHEDVIVVRRAGLRGYEALPSASLFGLWRARWD